MIALLSDPKLQICRCLWQAKPEDILLAARVHSLEIEQKNVQSDRNIIVQRYDRAKWWSLGYLFQTLSFSPVCYLSVRSRPVHAWPYRSFLLVFMSEDVYSSKTSRWVLTFHKNFPDTSLFVATATFRPPTRGLHQALKTQNNGISLYMLTYIEQAWNTNTLIY